MVTASFIVVSLLGYMYFVVFSQPVIEKDIRAQYLKGGDFQLLNNNQPFSLSQLRGKPVILYFGYTHCPDVCPVGLALIRDVLKNDEAFEKVSAIFITLDPDRDTTESLKEYTAFFHPTIIPLRGALDDTRKVVQAYGGFFRKVIPEGRENDDYLVDHSAYYYLISAEGELTRVFDHSVTVDQLSESLRPLL